MYRFLITAFLLFLVKMAVSQQPVFQWVKGLHENNIINYRVYNNGRTVGVDGGGNVYSAGLFEHTIDMDPGPGVSSITGGSGSEYGIYISKLDADGNFIWGKQIPVLVEFAQIELKVDADGNVYLASCFREQADMDPGPGVFMMKPIGARDAFVVKIDTNGNLVWAKQFGGPGDTVPEASALDLDKDNNVIVCGIFNNTVDFDPGAATFNLTSKPRLPFIVKLTNSGDFVWAKQFGSSVVNGSSGIFDVKCDSGGNICLVGDFSGNYDFDPGASSYPLTCSSGAFQDGYIAKLDASGNFIWVKQIPNTTTTGYNYYMYSRGIDIDGMNNIVTTGTFIGNRDFDPGTGIYTLSSIKYQDCYILKLSEQGAFLWARRIGNEEADGGNDVAVDKDNNVYTIGSFANGSDLDPGPGDYIINSNFYGAEALVKLDANGNFVYAAPCLSISSGSSLFRRMAIDDSRNIYITGAASGVSDFDPGPGQYPFTGGEETPFIYKLGPCAHLTTSTLDVSSCDSYILNNVRFDSTGTYKQVITNSFGCDSVITLNLTITKKFTQQTKIICEGDFIFAGGANQRSPGIYKDSLKTRQGCDSIVTTTLVVNSKPLPNLGADRDLCSNNQLEVTPGVFSSYQWQDMSTASNFKIRSAGVYWVTVTNSFNCSATDTLIIRNMWPLPSSFLKPRDSICTYESLEIIPANTYASYQWSTGATEKKLTTGKPGTYWLMVTDTNGCSGADTITVFQKNCMEGVYTSNAFSPNHDGKNDIFKPSLYGKVKKYQLIIYNRLGKPVFQTTELNKAWDGTSEGVALEPNTFIWVCTYQFEGQAIKTKKGTVTLLR